MTLDDALALHEELKAREAAVEAVLATDEVFDAQAKAARRERRAIAEDYEEIFDALTED